MLGILHVNDEAITKNFCVVEFILVAFHIFAAVSIHECDILSNLRRGQFQLEQGARSMKRLYLTCAAKVMSIASK